MSRAKKQNKGKGRPHHLRHGLNHHITKPKPGLHEIAAQLPGCLLCDGGVDVVGVFLPERPELWPGPPRVPGKLRVLYYGLCQRCLHIPEPERSEAIYASMKAGAPC